MTVMLLPVEHAVEPELKKAGDGALPAGDGARRNRPLWRFSTFPGFCSFCRFPFFPGSALPLGLPARSRQASMPASAHVFEQVMFDAIETAVRMSRMF